MARIIKNYLYLLKLFLIILTDSIFPYLSCSIAEIVIFIL